MYMLSYKYYVFAGILTIFRKPSFYIHLIIQKEMLQVIDVLNTQFQNKVATFGSAIY